LISKLATNNTRGTALGVYASSQFIGTFTGGLIGGIIHEYYGLPVVFVFGSIMALGWFLMTLLPTNNYKTDTERCN